MTSTNQESNTDNGSRKFSIMCDNYGQCDIFVGTAEPNHHPLFFQNRWLSDKGSCIPQNIMDAVSKLQEIAKRNNVPLADLCVYALGTVKTDSNNSTNDTKTTAESGPGSEPT